MVAAAKLAVGLMVTTLVASVTTAGTRVVPPFTMQSDWWGIGLGLAGVVVLASVALVLAWRAVARRADAEILRHTQ